MLALHQNLGIHQILGLHLARPGAPAPPAPTRGFTSPAEYARFASGMAAKGSSPEAIAWFLGGDP